MSAERFFRAAEQGDLPAIRALVAARPELVRLDGAENDEHTALALRGAQPGPGLHSTRPRSWRGHPYSPSTDRGLGYHRLVHDKLIAARGEVRALQRVLGQYRKPSVPRSLGQLATSVVPYVVGLLAMGAIAQVSYLLSLLLALPTAGFLIRVFIIFHDAGHGSLFRRSRWNRAVGYLAGILTFTPFQHWTHKHAMHHANAGDLDARGLGDVWTMTVREFAVAPRGLRLAYRVFRNPFVLFFLVAPVAFVVHQRVPLASTSNRAKWAIMWTNFGVALFVVAMSLPFGFVNFALVFTPVFAVASMVGTWLFYVQHQFDDVYWSRREGWDFTDAALSGSSYLALPRVLQWFTGNIGFHHVHHLNPGIPNYYLERAHREQPLFRQVPVLRLRDTVRCLSMRLYDETARQMVSFREGRRRAHVAHAEAAPA